MYVDVSKGVPKVEITDQKTGEIADQVIMISSGAGGGKSNCAETLAATYYYNKYKVIFVSDVKDKIESGFCMFEPTDRLHIRKLRKFGVPITAMPAKILHPFTFNIPEHKIPEIQFYTMPIKKIAREELAFISETDQDTSTIKVMIDTLNDLKKDEGLPHLIFYAEDKAESQDNYKGKQLRSLDANAFYTKGTQGSTLKTINTAIGLFKPFQIDYFLTPEDCTINLNMEEIINDQKHYTILTTKYIKDQKMKQFIIDNFLHELDRTLDKAKYPICLIIEEVRKLTPQKTEGYKIFLANDIKEILSTCRNKGKGVTEILTTQVYFDVHKDVRKSATEIIFGQTGSLDEIEDIAKALSLRRDEKTILAELQVGEFVSKSLNSYTEKWKPFRPPHMHADRGKIFEEEYARAYPERMREYTEIKEYIKTIKDKLDHEALLMAENYNQKIINMIKDKDKEKQQRAEQKIKTQTEKVIKKETKIRELELEQARTWKTKREEGKSYQKIADEYYNEHKIKIHKEQIRRAVERIEKIDKKGNENSNSDTETPQ